MVRPTDEECRAEYALRCPIDIGALKAYSARHSPSVGPTINRFLRSVTGIDDDTGYLDIQYRHSALTAALVDAGWLTDGREYAVGADPFKLPKLLRYLALRRFGRAFDDAGSWPRAAAHIIPLHHGLGLVLVNNRETILRGLGALLLPLRNAGEQRRVIKRLFSRLELDGTYYLRPVEDVKSASRGQKYH